MPLNLIKPLVRLLRSQIQEREATMFSTPQSSKEKPAAGSVFALSVGIPDGPKVGADWVRFRVGMGIEGNGHPEKRPFQVGILSKESMDKNRPDEARLFPGFCGNNICTASINLANVDVGNLLEIGGAILLVTQKGKQCQ